MRWLRQRRLGDGSWIPAHGPSLIGWSCRHKKKRWLPIACLGLLLVAAVVYWARPARRIGRVSVMSAENSVNKSIHDACRNGDLESVRNMLASDPSLVDSDDHHNWRPSWGTTATVR